MLEIRLWEVHQLSKCSTTSLHSGEVNTHLVALLCVKITCNFPIKPCFQGSSDLCPYKGELDPVPFSQLI